MMQFAHTWKSVISGQKTQTRRVWNPKWESFYYYYSDDPHYITVIRNHNQRNIYYKGQILSVQPGRGKKGVARIEIIRMWREDVRQISVSNLRAEGFPPIADFPTHHEYARSQFLDLWTWMHGSNYDALPIEFELLEVFDSEGIKS